MRARGFTLAAFVLAVVAALVAAFAPTGQLVESSGSPGGAIVTRSSHVSTFQADGAWVLMVVSVPVLVALAPILIPRRGARIVSAVLLWIGCVVGMWSIGMFFVPAAIVMTLAATRREPEPVPPTPLFRT